jgi:ubiquinone/menaquinone biosynthesis C-methylase UbiE
MTSETAAYWDDAADSFDDEPDHGLRDPQVRAAWLALLQRVLPPAPARIADLGCGTGSLSVLLAGAGYEVTGLDFSTAMTAAAKAKAIAAGVEARFVVGDAADPPLGDAGFDAVLCRHVLWALPDRQAALARWITLLAAYGRLVLIEGRWSTGAGMPPEEITSLVRQARESAELTMLDDARLWGREIIDQRYLVVSLR